MIKRTITYTDYNGNEQTEDFYFDLTAAELTEFQWSTDEGVSVKLENIIKTDKKSEIMKYFKEILLMSVGKKSDDGRRFIKNQDVIDDFVQSPAYNILFMELVNDAKIASDFINGVIPDLEEIDSMLENNE